VYHLLVTPLSPLHARQGARLHIQGQPGTFLTSLGEEVLAVVYRALPQTRGGFGFAAVQLSEPGASPRLQPAGGELPLLGYISATTGVGGLFLEVASQQCGELLLPLMRRYRQDPLLALRSMQAALYPFLTPGEREGEPAAELLSIMVEPAIRSHGIGALLMAAFLHECRNRGLAAVNVTVDAANEGAQEFYRRHGFAARQNIVLFGRPMYLFRRRLK
jgi:ribosomal protein S18 acetylase RimI-like enzyme